jgi:hypothetical protein
MKIFKEIINLFQFRLKWVRIMMIVSVLTVFILFILPVQKQKVPVKILREFAMEEASNDSTIIEPIVAQQPLEIKIITEKEEKPFDWKGTITWAIGAMNGIILVILNIKNILKKK